MFEKYDIMVDFLSGKCSFDYALENGCVSCLAEVLLLCFVIGFIIWFPVILDSESIAKGILEGVRFSLSLLFVILQVFIVVVPCWLVIGKAEWGVGSIFCLVCFILEFITILSICEGDNITKFLKGRKSKDLTDL